MGKIWSDKCDDPTSIIIMDSLNGDIYTDEAARNAPPEVRKRLVNHATRKGYWVEDGK